MSNKPLNISDEASTSANAYEDGCLALIALVAMGVWAYFGIVLKLNKHSTTIRIDFKKIWNRELQSLESNTRVENLVQSARGGRAFHDDGAYVQDHGLSLNGQIELIRHENTSKHRIFKKNKYGQTTN